MERAAAVIIQLTDGVAGLWFLCHMLIKLKCCRQQCCHLSIYSIIIILISSHQTLREKNYRAVYLSVGLLKS